MTELLNASYKIQAGPIKNLGLVNPEPGAIALNEEDGHVYIANAYGWVRVGETEKPFHFFFDYDGVTQLTILWKAPSTSTVVWDWGDDTVDNIAGNDGTFVTTLSAYTAPGTYYVQLSGDVLDLTSINIGNQPGLVASLNGMGRLTNLTFLGLNNLNITGSVEFLDGFTATEIYLIELPHITGDASRLSNNSLNTQIEGCPLTTFSSVAPFVARSGAGMVFVDNGWTGFEVDNCIRSMLLATDSNIHVHANDFRTEASNSAIVALLNAGNTLTVNEATPLQGLGPELMTIASAVSDPAGNEANGTAGWTPTGLGSPNIFESQNRVVSVGRRAFKIDANPVPTANADIQLTAPVTVVLDDLLRYGFDYRHLGDGERWQFRPNLTEIGFYLKPEWLEYQKFAVYLKSPGATFEPQYRERSPSNNGGIYVDNVSLKKLL